MTESPDPAGPHAEGHKVHPAFIIGLFVLFVVGMVFGMRFLVKTVFAPPRDAPSQGKGLIPDIAAVMGKGDVAKIHDELRAQYPFQPPAGNRVQPAQLDRFLKVRQSMRPSYASNLRHLKRIHKFTTAYRGRGEEDFSTLSMLADMRRDHAMTLRDGFMSLEEYAWLTSLVYERVMPAPRGAEPKVRLEWPPSLLQAEGKIPDDVTAAVQARPFGEVRLEYLDDLLILTPFP